MKRGVPPEYAGPAARIAVLTTLVSLAWWASWGILRLLWRRWVRVEQAEVLAHGHLGGKEPGGLVSIGMLVWVISGMAFLVLRGMPIALDGLFSDPGELILGLVVVFALARGSTLLLLRLRPGPRTGERSALEASLSE